MTDNQTNSSQHKTDSNETVIGRLNYYLKQRDYNLEYSDDRLKQIQGMCEDSDDSVIINYISTQQYKNSHVKKKKDRLSEHDPIYKKLDSLAYYILKSEFKNEEHKKQFENDQTGTVLNNTGENNIAYKKDYKIKESERNYGYPIMSVYAMNRNRSDNFNMGKNKIREIPILNEVKHRFPNQIENENEAFDYLELDSHVNIDDLKKYERLVYSFKDPKNVLLFLRYQSEVLSEATNYVESDIRLVSQVLQDIIKELGFDKTNITIIKLLKDGMDYTQIAENLCKKTNSNYTYDMVRYRVYEILNSISNRIKDKINKLI